MEQKAKALSSEVRVKILKLLKNRPHTLSEVARELKISKTNASVHLKKLAVVGLIQQTKRSKWVYYSLKPELVEAGSVSIVIPLISLVIAVISLWQAFRNTLPPVISPDHEYSAFFGGFTPLGLMLLVISILAFFVFLISVVWLAWNKFSQAC